ncbi:MAG: hypothetical protein QOI94_1991 [Acidobacteriaceae bacterium]|nr:hypothetical protein [Acidobacteriaceae bacterium]
MEGELDARTDIESPADVFESTLAGIRIAAKAGKTRPALRRIAGLRLARLPLLNHRFCELGIPRGKAIARLGYRIRHDSS